MSGRAARILGRLPVHLEAARPGKRLGAVAGALATDLDVLAARLAGVRRAHRLADADEVVDLLGIAARHGIGRDVLDTVFQRFSRGRTLIDALAGAGQESTRAEAAETLCALWGLADPAPRLPLFAPHTAAEEAPEPRAAAVLLRAARAALGDDALLAALRRVIAGACRGHAAGNATVGALLVATANILDLEVMAVEHSADRFWHAATVNDRLALHAPGVDGSAQRLPPAPEVLGLEENPRQRARTDAMGRRHGERFSLVRRGFQRTLLQVRVIGEEEDRTIAPMLVNRDEGHGVGYSGRVPPGQDLVFTESGRVQLDGTDVTAMAFAWRGACFAGADPHPGRDFVFAGPGAGSRCIARFATTTPPGALDRGARFPHAGSALGMPGIGIGETRLAFFVQAAHFSTTVEERGQVTPRTAVAFAGASVFGAGPDEISPPAARLGLSWLEHRAFSVRVLVPARFRDLDPDDAGAQGLRRRLAGALDRVRPAGVEVEVDFVDQRWVLGRGSLLDEVHRPLARLRGGTWLWPAPDGGEVSATKEAST